MKLDIHNIDKSLEQTIERINNLSENNRNIILSFKRQLEKTGLSNTRILFYLIRLNKICNTIKKGLDKVTKEDIEDFVIRIEKNKEYSEWTKAGYKKTIKKFFKWYKPDIDLDWLKTTPKKSKLKDPVILTKEEILTIFQIANGLREKALASFMYESGCRSPDELLNMVVSDVVFNDVGAKVKLTSGKVGSRNILVISCVPHLKAWIENEHPNPKPNSYLWTRKGADRVLGYASLLKLVRKWRKKAKITKKITPYTFRRTRYTHLANKIPTPALYSYMGQVQGSKVIDRYVKLSGEDTDEAIMSFYGLANPKNKDIKAKFCSRCGKQNPPELEYCNICNSPLTEKAKLEVEEKKRMELKNFVEELIQKRIKELKK